MLWVVEGGNLGEDVEVHVLAEGVFAEHFIGLARGVHAEVVAQVSLLGAFLIIHVNMPVWICAVKAGCDAIAILGKFNVYTRFLHTFLQVGLPTVFDVIELRVGLPTLYLPQVLVPDRTVEADSPHPLCLPSLPLPHLNREI